jgi:VIT1/CCC1 family predicted Fe2+/Mn2+ transporter
MGSSIDVLAVISMLNFNVKRGRLVYVVMIVWCAKSYYLRPKIVGCCCSGDYLVAFEIQELPDVIRVIVLLNLSKGVKIKKSTLKHRIDRVCVNYACIEITELDKALKEMSAEGLIIEKDGMVQLSAQGQKLGKEWESLLLKKDPIMEVVAGLVDGSVTSLVVILSAFIATFTASSIFHDVRTVIFTAFLTLSAVAITNFSSFLLGGITEDLNDIMTLQNLMNYSLSDIPDKKERDKSLMLVQKLFTLLSKQIHRSNLYAAIICGTTTFIAGIIPIATYLVLPPIYNIIISLILVGVISGVFLARYRSKKTRVNWKITFAETFAIVVIATVASLLLGAA